MKRSFASALFNIVCGILIAVAIGAAMSFSYEDELAERHYYCEMVGIGAWPDYKNIFVSECKGE